MSFLRGHKVAIKNKTGLQTVSRTCGTKTWDFSGRFKKETEKSYLFFMGCKKKKTNRTGTKKCDKKLNESFQKM